MKTFTIGLFIVTVSMSAVIVLLSVLSKLFGRRFTAKCRYIVWIAVILRLCIPAGLFGIAPLIEVRVPEKVSAPAEVSEANVPEYAPTMREDVTTESPAAPALPAVEVKTSAENKEPAVTPQTPSPVPTPTERRVPEPASEKHPVDTGKIISFAGMAWITCAALIFAVRLISYVVYARRLRKSGVLTEESGELSDIYQAAAEKAGVKKTPRLLVSREPTSPFLFGYFKPCIVVPGSVAEEKNACEILSHELTHFRRGDVFVKLACAAAKSIHFFNPFVYAAAGRCTRELELSCDEAVLRGFDAGRRLSYGNTMLDIVGRCGLPQSSEFTSYFNPKHGALKERIMNICDTTKKRKGITVIALSLVLCLLAGAVLGCTVDEKKTAGSETSARKKPEERVYYVPVSLTYRYDGITYVADITYGDGDITAVRTADGERDYTFKAVYSGGLLTELRVSDRNGGLRRIGRIEYTDDGKLRYARMERGDSFFLYGLHIDINYGEDALCTKYLPTLIGPEKGSTIYKRNTEDGTVTVMNDATGHGDHNDVTTYKFTDGRLTERTRTFPVEYPPNRFHDDSVYVYDENGNLIREDNKYYTLYEDADKYNYDKTVEYIRDDDGTLKCRTETVTRSDGTEQKRDYLFDPYGEFIIDDGESDFDAGLLESSGGAVKWKETDKETFDRYIQLYKTELFPDVNEEANTENYLITVHKWCFDDIGTALGEEMKCDDSYWTSFVGNDVDSEIDARSAW